jgi:hypothetical protein
MRPLALLLPVLLWPTPNAVAQTGRNRSVIILEDRQNAPSDKPALSDNPPAQTPSPIVPEGESRLDNSAGLKLDFVPGTDLSVGSKMSLRISTEQQGYLLLVDVNSEGKLTQIYPNSYSPRGPNGSEENTNLLKPGTTMTVPESGPETGFELVASPPPGVGMIVAILSDKPVQVIDLPDIPAAIIGRRAADEYLRGVTRSLKILPDNDSGQILDPKWSFATKFYSIH